MRGEDLTGRTFATLEVIGKAKSRGSSGYWNCKCNACGRRVEVATSNLRSPLLRSCGCLRKRGGNTHPNWKGYGELSLGVYHRIKDTAIRRGISFSVSIKYLWNLFLRQRRRCALSGVLLTIQAMDHTGTASLDRKDSTRGYTASNVQWVHKDVNFMKHSLPQKRFIEMCKRVTKHNKGA